MANGLKPFKKGQVCYYLLGNQIHKGIVKGEFELDSINTKYLVETSGGRIWMFDHHLFHSLNELIEDLKSCIIA